MKSGTIKHPKTLALAEELRRRFPALTGNVADHVAVSILARLWDWTAQYAPTGNLARWSLEAIARGLEFAEDPEAVLDALMVSGWLDRTESGDLVVHDWKDHCEGWIHAKLARKGERFHDGTAPSFRYLKSGERAGVEALFTQGCGRSTSETVDGPRARLRKPLAFSHLPLAKEEDSLKAPLARGSKPPSRQDDSKILMTFETVGTPKQWHFRQSLMDPFQEAYPNVDVLAELAKAKAWLVANPTKRKTARGMPAFLNRWLSRSVDSGRGSGNGKAGGGTDAELDPEIAAWAANRKKGGAS